LPDASGRERLILATMAVAIIFMGVASPLFTRRMQSSTNNLLNQMERVHNVSRPAMHDPAATRAAVAARPPENVSAKAISLRRVQP
jgi:hypothetical protein